MFKNGNLFWKWLNPDEPEDDSWRYTCEDGTEYGVIPEAYDTEEEYLEALEEAKYGWRDTCIDGSDYGIYPNNYETEAEYIEALENAKYSWRDTCEDGDEYGINPDDYETEAEYIEALEEAKYEWRDTCEDGSIYGIDPDDYETEEEYTEALDEAKEEAGQNDDSDDDVTVYLTFEDDDDNDNDNDNDDDNDDDDDDDDEKEENKVKRSDYPNERMYRAAYKLEERRRIYGKVEESEWSRRLKFILEKSDEIIAAKYLSADGEFLYSQAIKDHFELPVTIPDEDEERKFELGEILKKITRKDIDLAIRVWVWCFESFAPYSQYEFRALDTLVYAIREATHEASEKVDEEFSKKLIEYLDLNRDFMKKFADGIIRTNKYAADYVFEAVKQGKDDLAIEMFGHLISEYKGNWKNINLLVDGIVDRIGFDSDLVTGEFFMEKLLPVIKAVDDPMVTEEIEVWEEKVNEHIKYVESYNQKYAYSRANAWRCDMPGQKEYDLDPTSYDSRDEYLDALKSAMFYEEDIEVSDLSDDPNPCDYSSADEFYTQLKKICAEAIKKRRAEEKALEEAERIEEERRLAEEKAEEERWLAEENAREAERLAREEAEEAKRRAEEEENRKYEELNRKDKTVYRYCGVSLKGFFVPLSYRTDDMSICVGDKVIVPLGNENKETSGYVVFVGDYLRKTAPYPPEKTKFIISKE